MTIPDPHSVLGLSRGADRAAVKRAYRQKALQTHPDINPSPAAAQEYDRIFKAAQAILNKTEYNPTSQGRPVEQGWKLAFEQFTRKSTFPLIFSAACLVGGCIIFAGALHAHTAIFDGALSKIQGFLEKPQESSYCCLYSYHVLEEAERRKESPSPEQQRINMLLMEKREQNLAGRRQ